MGSWHVHHIYRLAILVMLLPPIPLVVSEAVFHADNYPNRHRQIRSQTFERRVGNCKTREELRTTGL